MSYDYGIKYISKHTGLTGVESKNIAMALKSKDIDYTTVDWKTIGEDTKDFGNRSGAVWNKLGSMSGISKLRTGSSIKYDIMKSKEHNEAIETPVYGIQMEMCLSKHLRRTPGSIRLDDVLKAKHIFKPTNLKGVTKWMKNPNRYDILGVDYFPKIRKRKR